MDKKICLDTDVCIGIINGKIDFKYIFDKFGAYDVYLTSITIFELFLRETNLEEISEFIQNFQVLNFDDTCAKKSSDIFKDLKRKGNLLEFRDVFTASTCMVHNCALLTLNEKHFKKISGLNLLKI